MKEVIGTTLFFLCIIVLFIVGTVVRNQHITQGKTIVIDNASYKCRLIHDLKED